MHGLYVLVNSPQREPAKISVWIGTAHKTKVVTPPTFVRTLLHEFCHHIDYEHFGFAETFHTGGFVLLNAVMGKPIPKSSKAGPQIK